MKSFYSVHEIIRAIDLLKQLNKYSGLTAPQLLILREIVARDGITASEVAQNITLSPATVSNIIERMEHRGLIYRRRSNTDVSVDVHYRARSIATGSSATTLTGRLY